MTKPKRERKNRIGRFDWMMVQMGSAAFLAIGPGVIYLAVAFGGLGALSRSDLAWLTMLSSLIMGAFGLCLIAASLYGAWLGDAHRLHDLGISGLWSVLRFVPGINIVFWIFLLLAPGQKGPNQYGRE